MNLLSVDSLQKRFGERILFNNISFGLEKGQKMALVAKNGEGKTTLLELLMGIQKPDNGIITWRNNIKIGYLKQSHDFDNKSLKQVLYQTESPSVDALQKYQEALNNPEDDKQMQIALNLMDETKAWDFESKIQKLIKVFGLDQIDLESSTSKLSGGQKKRLALIQLILQEADVLILDEPTNHLDITMIEWLEDYFSQENISLFLVTHDRYFLNRVSNQILELDDTEVYKYQGNYEYYLEKKAEREEMKAAEIDKAKNLYRTEVEWMRRMPKARGTKAKSRIDQFHDTEKVAKQRISSEEVQLSIKTERLGGKIIELHHLSKSFGDVKIVDDFSYVFKKNDRIGIAGNNGVGKTTFLNLLLGKETADKGKVIHGETVKFGYYSQLGIKLKEDKRIIDVVKDIAEIIPLEKGRKITASQLLERFLFPPKLQYNYVSKLSGGEKKRLYLLTVLMSNPNFLILDEPTNDLDIKTIGILEQFLSEYPGCLLIVSHDRAFMDRITNHIFHLKGQGKIKDFPGNYSQLLESIKQEQQEKTVSAKPKKTVEAKEVKDVKKLDYLERKEYNKLEKEIEKLEGKKEELNQEMISASSDGDQLLNLSEQLGKLVDEIEEKTLRWMELAERA